VQRSALACVMVLSAVPFGCSASSGSARLSLGNDGAGGAASNARLGAGGSFLVTGDAGLSRGLSAHVESPPGVTVTFVTLTCSTECTNVQAVATGGFEPYTFAWEDGSTNPVRRLCPTSTSTFTVSVTDTGSNSKEFTRAPQTVSAPVTARVLECTGADAAVPPTGTGGTGAADAGTGAPRMCTSIPLTNGTCANAEGIISPITGEALVAGVRQGFRLSGNASYIAGQPWHYEIWGSKDGCSLDEQLDAFQLPPSGPADLRWCGASTASFDHVVLFYRYAATDALSFTNLTLSWCTECGS
jgi:hypothetical protein